MESLHYLLMKSHTLLNRRIIAGASAAGLSSGQPKILEYLYLFGENNQKMIAEYCEIEQATAGSILLRMEQAGLIERSFKEGNRRSLYVSLTEEGRIAAEKMQRVFEEKEKETCMQMKEEEILQLRILLDKFCSSAQRRETKKYE